MLSINHQRGLVPYLAIVSLISVTLSCAYVTSLFTGRDPTEPASSEIVAPAASDTPAEDPYPVPPGESPYPQSPEYPAESPYPLPSGENPYPQPPGAPPPSESPYPEPLTQESPTTIANFKPFPSSIEGFNFTLDYPETWEIDDLPETKTFTHPEQGASFVIQAYKDFSGDNAALFEYYKEQNCSEDAVERERQELEVGGQPAMRAIYTCMGTSGPPQGHNDIFFVYENTGFVLSGRALINQFPANEGVFTAIQSSFQFNP